MPEGKDPPATKADLQEVRAELKADIQNVRSDMQAMEAHLVERIRDSQTELLRAFHGWARTMEVRSRGTTTAVVGFDERLMLVEDRVSELERRNIG